MGFSHQHKMLNQTLKDHSVSAPFMLLLSSWITLKDLQTTLISPFSAGCGCYEAGMFCDVSCCVVKELHIPEEVKRVTAEREVDLFLTSPKDGLQLKVHDGGRREDARTHVRSELMSPLWSSRETSLLIRLNPIACLLYYTCPHRWFIDLFIVHIIAEKILN